MTLLFEAIRLLAIVGGLAVAYVAAFTYEDTDKRIRNWLEDVWLRLAFDAGTPVGVARRIVRVVLNLLEKISDRLFGPSYVSIRTLSVALCYAFGALLLSYAMVHFYARLAELDPPKMMAGWRQPLIIAAVAFAMGTLPAVHASLRWVTYLAVFWMLASFVVFVWVLTTNRLDVTAVLGSAVEDLRAPLVSIALVLAYGTGLIHAIRYGLNRTVNGNVTRRDAVFVGCVLLIPVVAFAALTSISVIARHPRGQLTLWLASQMQSNRLRFLLFSLGAPLSPWGLGLFAVSLIVLFHITTWPVIRFILMNGIRCPPSRPDNPERKALEHRARPPAVCDCTT
jgi:hypothetical protein